jgi:tetratricopeptide (TPR) repeat protein
MINYKTLTITIDNKILIYLLDFDRRDEFKEVVPIEVTQEGIADGVSNPLGSVSRTLKKMVKEGLLQENLNRIINRKRKMKAYALTWDGKAKAKDIEKELRNEIVAVKNPKGNIKEKKLGDAVKGFKPKPRLIDLINYLSTYPVIDRNGLKEYIENQSIRTIPEFDEPDSEVTIEPAPIEKPSSIELPPSEKSAEYLQMVSTIPKIRHFYGREEEFAKLEEFFKNYKILIINGIAGIGKSVLAAKFLLDKKDQNNIFWYSLKEWDTNRNALLAIAEFLNGLGKTTLKSYLNSNLTTNFYDIIKILTVDLNDTNSILVFDDFHRADERTVQLFSAITEEIDKISNSYLIVISRTEVQFYDRRDVNIEKNVLELKLDGLNKKDSMEFIQNKGIEDQEFNLLYELTKGHPLALELIDSIEDIKISKGKSKDIFKFIHEEIFSKLSEEEISILQILSIYRQPVLPEAFMLEDYINFNTIDGLLSKALIVEIYTQKFMVQDMVRDFFYSRLAPAKRIKSHEFAAEYFIKQGETSELEEELDAGSNYIEAAYHLIEAEKQNEAVELILNKAPSMISKGNSEGIMNVLSKFDTKNIDTSYLAHIYTIKGDILDLWGEWDNVLEYYYQCYILSKYVKYNIPPSKLHEIIGYMGWKTHEIDIALENLRNSMAVLEGTADPEGVDEVNRSLGWIHWLKGDYKKAIDYYNKVIAKKPTSSDQSARGKIYINLGNIFWEKNKFDKAFDYYNKSLKIFDKLEDFQKVALVNNYLGCIHVDQEEFDKAIEYFNKSIEICSKINFVRCEGYVYLHLAQLWLKQQDQKNCIANLEKALKIFDKIDDKFGLSYGKVNYGLIFTISENYSEAIIPFNESVELLKTLDLPFYLAEVYLGNSLIYEKLDKKDNSKEYNRMANQIFKVLGGIAKGTRA